MLRIRKEQLETLKSVALARFKIRAARHIWSMFPQRCDELGTAEVCRSVDLAIDKAKNYRLGSQREYIRYLLLMYAIGFEFDKDQTLPWANEILTDQESTSWERMEALMNRAQAHLQAKT